MKLQIKVLNHGLNPHVKSTCGTIGTHETYKTTETRDTRQKVNRPIPHYKNSVWKKLSN